MARKKQPDQRKSRVKSSEGQIPNPGQKVNASVEVHKQQ
jgi:hypothetical protein